MQKDWFPFFSKLFWLCTKLAGLAMLLTGLTALLAMLSIGFSFWQLLLSVIAPICLGWLLLITEVLYDFATAEMMRRNVVNK
jgi:hypothetical protein